MRRRAFITLLGGVAAAWPLAARAQRQGRVPRIGFLGLASPTAFAPRLEGIRLGLRDFGYIEGTNITIEYRWAQGQYERLPELAAELVRSKVDLILTHRKGRHHLLQQLDSFCPELRIEKALASDVSARRWVSSSTQTR